MSSGTLALGGKFSGNFDMVGGGYSQDIGETFADTIAQRVVGRILATSPRYATTQARRDAYFSSIAWTCEEPSFRTKYSEETALLKKKYSLDGHDLNQERQLRFLSPQVREALQCKLADAPSARDTGCPKL